MEADMAWLELHQSLLNHRKTLELADLLGLPPLYAASHMVALWLWALDNAPNGDLHVRVTIISRAAQWVGDANLLVGAMIESGFLDQDDDGISIHDWDDYAGKLLDARREHAETMRNWRKSKRSERDNHVTITRDAPLSSRDEQQYSTEQVNYDGGDDAPAQERKPQPGLTNLPPAIKADFVLRKYLLDKAATLMSKGTLSRAQENSLSAWFTTHRQQLAPDLIDYGVTQAADHTGGDSLAYFKTVVENKINGVEKPPGRANGNGGNHNGQNNPKPSRLAAALDIAHREVYGIGMDEVPSGGNGRTTGHNQASPYPRLPSPAKNA
jgi:hypothetical protein